jgi:hypothetical protein
MAKTNVSEQSVFAICDRVYIETGKDPRYEDLTGELNCSNSTVKPFFDSWQGQPRPGRHPIPEKLASTLESFAQAMWGHALGAAVGAVLPDKEEMQAGFVRCQEQLTSALQIVEEGEQERIRMQAQVRALMQQLAELQVRLDIAASAPARCNDLEKVVEDLRKERDAANARASDALGQVSAHERHIQVLLNSMREEPTRRATRRRPPVQDGDARG